MGPTRWMRLARQAASALWSQLGKTFLMLAGIAVGIMLLTTVVGLSGGVERRIAEVTSMFGPRSIILFAGGGTIEGPPGRAVSSATLKLEDAAALRERLSDAIILSAGVPMSDVSVKAGDQNTQTMVSAWDPEFPQASDWGVASGDPIDAEDEREMARVCVLGTTAARNLFGDQDPVGQRVLINHVQFKVKGVLAEKGANAVGFDMDDRVWIPLSTGMHRVFHLTSIRAMRMKVREGRDLSAVTEEVKGILRERHHIVPPEEDDFRMLTPDYIAQRAHSMALTAELVGGVLAAIALVVGGVVLMNILLLTVAERVPEIGLKRALGATRADIFVEFLSEALIVSLLGMALGVALGLVPVLLIPRLYPMIPMAVTWRTFAWAALFSTAVGVLFGVQPARRAARLDPVTALQ
jgi:putative ABC transport system permease protein